MLIKLLLLFTCVPLLELIVLIQMGKRIGLWPTVFIVVITGFVGVFLARAQGFAILFRIREDLEGGRIPTDELMNGLCVLVGAAMLLTPGLITDAVGFSLILPITRVVIKRFIRTYIKKMIEKGNIKIL
jgi:UPF0716 protein FxsA